MAPRLRRGFGGQAPPFRIFAGGIPRSSTGSGRNAEGAEERSTFGLIQEYGTVVHTIFERSNLARLKKLRHLAEFFDIRVIPTHYSCDSQYTISYFSIHVENSDHKY